MFKTALAQTFIELIDINLQMLKIANEDFYWR